MLLTGVRVLNHSRVKVKFTFVFNVGKKYEKLLRGLVKLKIAGLSERFRSILRKLKVSVNQPCGGFNVEVC
ncbi:MAG: hypothetical protein N3E48_00395 [Candidatus Bathyarchaeota archaeon]|nr:hypothetical protein [Candidatus Bathyarchaeota archaeon]